MRKYDPGAFQFEIMLECPNSVEVDEYEDMFIELYDCKVPNGYNVRDAGFRGKFPKSFRRDRVRYDGIGGILDRHIYLTKNVGYTVIGFR